MRRRERGGERRGRGEGDDREMRRKFRWEMRRDARVHRQNFDERPSSLRTSTWERDERGKDESERDDRWKAS